MYNKGKVVPMEEVTWKLLCSFFVYADFFEDTHVEWPERIKEERRQAIKSVFKHLNLETNDD